MSAWLSGLGVAAGVAVSFWALGRFLPPFLVKQIHGLFARAKASPWFRNPAKPKRARLLLALAEFLEDEIPEPGQGREFYAALGARVASLAPFLVGTGPKWADALEKAGDAIDLELDEEIKDLSK